jgi:hypothetical protein
MNRPDVISEVPSQLAQNGRHGVGGERLPARRVETVDRLHEAQVGDLEQIVEWLAAAPIPQRQRTREWHEPLHELLANGVVAGFGKAAQEQVLACALLRVDSDSTALGLAPGGV